MPNRVVIFPETKEAEAQSYLAVCDAEYALLYPEDTGTFGYIRPDIEGQHVVPYLGPPFTVDGINPVPEPAACIPARVDGVIHEYAIWPVEEEV